VTLRLTTFAFAGSLLLAAASACEKPKPIELTPRSAALASVSPAGLTLALVLDAKNPNSFDITASEVSAVVELQNGVELGRGTAPPSFTIPAEKSVPLNALLDVKWTNLAPLAPYAVSLQPLPYRIRGTARVGGGKLSLEMPFNIEGSLTPQQVAQATLSGVLGGAAPR
jgi:hypothetical protein